LKVLFDFIFAVKMPNAGGAVCTGDRTVDEMSDSCRFSGIRYGNALSGLFFGTLFIGCAHRINSVNSARSAHQGIMVSEVTDSDLNPLLTQSLSCRRGRISRQSPDLMSSGQ
jgi:hypothetical protein